MKLKGIEDLVEEKTLMVTWLMKIKVIESLCNNEFR